MKGKFPNIEAFCGMSFSISIFNTSLLIIFTILLSEYFNLSSFVNSKSFSITINDLGLFFKISSVRAPLPGPISTIFLFLIFDKHIIFL